MGAMKGVMWVAGAPLIKELRRYLMVFLSLSVSVCCRSSGQCNGDSHLIRATERVMKCEP